MDCGRRRFGSSGAVPTRSPASRGRSRAARHWRWASRPTSRRSAWRPASAGSTPRSVVPRGALRERVGWGGGAALASCVSVALATAVQGSVAASARRRVRVDRAHRVPAHLRPRRWPDRLCGRRDLRDHQRHPGRSARRRGACPVVRARIARRGRPDGRRLRARRAGWRVRRRTPLATVLDPRSAAVPRRALRRRPAASPRAAPRGGRRRDHAALPAARARARLLGPAHDPGGAAAGRARERRAGDPARGRHARRYGPYRPAH